MAQMIPPILLGPIAGVFVDRWDRRRTMIAAEVILAAVLLPLLAVRSGASLWLVPVAAIAEAAAFQFVPPCSSALFPAIVGRERLPQANALISSGTNLSVLIGPPLGAVLLHVLGLSGVVLVDVGSYLGAALMVALIVLPPQKASTSEPGEAKETTRFWHEWIEGLQLVRAERWIAGLFAVEATAMLGAGMVWVTSIIFIELTLHESALQYGWWLSLNAVGGIAGSLLLARVARHIAPAWLIVGGTMLAGLTWLATAWFRMLPVMLAPAPVMAVGGVAWSVSEQTMLQSGVPDRYLGRVFGAHGAVTSLAVLLGLGAASLLSSVLGPVPLLTIASILYISAGLVAAVWLRSALSGPTAKIDEDAMVVPPPKGD